MAQEGGDDGAQERRDAHGATQKRGVWRGFGRGRVWENTYM
jgi:hypothetical protein